MLFKGPGLPFEELFNIYELLLFFSDELLPN